MICLALDFAGPRGQAAVAQADRVLDAGSRPAGPGTVEGIVPFTLATLETAGLTMDDVGLIVVTTGPGSFTGIRAGLAAALGFGAAAGCPIHGITVFDAFGLTLPADPRPALIALDGRREDLFVQLRAPDGEPLGEPANIAPGALAGWAPAGALRLAGSAAESARTAMTKAGRPMSELQIVEGGGTIDIGRLARLGAGASASAKFGAPVPLYGREPDVSKPA